MFFNSCKLQYENNKQLLKKEGATIFISHFGEFNSQKISELTTESEEYLLKSGAVKRTIKSTFNILIEGLQNIINHGELSPNGKQLGFFNLAESDHHYQMNFSNLIQDDKIEKIQKSIERLNTSDDNEIKNLYLEKLTNGEISAKGGAGLGIITMAMKSKNKIQFQTKSIDDNLSILTIEVKINKN